MDPGPAPRRCTEPSGANAARSATSVFVAVLTKSLRLTAEDCLTTEGRSSAGPQKTRKRALNKNCVAQGGMAPGRGSRNGLCNNLKMSEKPQGTKPLQVVNLSEGWARLGSRNKLSLCKLLIYPRDEMKKNAARDVISNNILNYQPNFCLKKCCVPHF